MNPYYRLCAMVIRVVAAGCMVFTLLDLLLYWLNSRRDHTDLSLGKCLYLSIPLVVGLALLVKSSALARRAAEYLDD